MQGTSYTLIIPALVSISLERNNYGIEMVEWCISELDALEGHRMPKLLLAYGRAERGRERGRRGYLMHWNRHFQ